MLTATKKRKHHLWIIICIKLNLAHQNKGQDMNEMRRMAQKGNTTVKKKKKEMLNQLHKNFLKDGDRLS